MPSPRQFPVIGWQSRRAQYEVLARGIDPSVRLVTKDGWFWKALSVLVTIFTFGGIKPRQFLEDYATTIGPIQAYPRKWKVLSGRLLVHEARHTRHCRWLGLWIHPWVGLPLYALLYLSVFFPIGLAFFRWRFEIDADKASYRYMLRQGYSVAVVRDRAKSFGKTVCGGNYGWAWIFWGVRGFQNAAEQVIAEARREGVI